MGNGGNCCIASIVAVEGEREDGRHAFVRSLRKKSNEPPRGEFYRIQGIQDVCVRLQYRLALDRPRRGGGIARTRMGGGLQVVARTNSSRGQIISVGCCVILSYFSP